MIFSAKPSTKVDDHRLSVDPDFTAPVANNGYRWWYIDGLSDDGLCGLTIIVFVGCVFSPHYFRARKKGGIDPRNHVAVNAILYGKGGKRWSLTERSERSLTTTFNKISIGPSQLSFSEQSAQVHIRELTVPLPGRLQGDIRITPEVENHRVFTLDNDGEHHWRPIWPRARIEVSMQRPLRRWEGNAYVDSNWGEAPLESAFESWDWSRLHLPDGRIQIRYNRQLTGAVERNLALTFGHDGTLEETTAQPSMQLPVTPVWRMHRPTSAAGPTSVIKTLEDTPFYARSLIQQQEGSLVGTGFHESVDLRRFSQPWVQMLLPFRLPRAG